MDIQQIIANAINVTLNNQNLSLSITVDSIATKAVKFQAFSNEDGEAASENTIKLVIPGDFSGNIALNIPIVVGTRTYRLISFERIAPGDTTLAFIIEGEI